MILQRFARVLLYLIRGTYPDGKTRSWRQHYLRYIVRLVTLARPTLTGRYRSSPEAASRSVDTKSPTPHTSSIHRARGGATLGTEPDR